jgi:hypothetical protein
VAGQNHPPLKAVPAGRVKLPVFGVKLLGAHCVIFHNFFLLLDYSTASRGLPVAQKSELRAEEAVSPGRGSSGRCCAADRKKKLRLVIRIEIIINCISRGVIEKHDAIIPIITKAAVAALVDRRHRAVFAVVDFDKIA